MCGITKFGTLRNAENEFLFATVLDTMWLVATTQRFLDTGADDARDDHESKRHKGSVDTVPMAQEPSSGSGAKRSNIEAIRRADAEAEKALQRARDCSRATSSQERLNDARGDGHDAGRS